MLAEAQSSGSLFKPQFLLYGPTISRPITFSSLFPAVNWLTSGFVYLTLSLNWLTRRLQTIRKNSNKRTTE